MHTLPHPHLISTLLLSSNPFYSYCTFTDWARTNGKFKSDHFLLSIHPPPEVSHSPPLTPSTSPTESHPHSWGAQQSSLQIQELIVNVAALAPSCCTAVVMSGWAQPQAVFSRLFLFSPTVPFSARRVGRMGVGTPEWGCLWRRRWNFWSFLFAVIRQAWAGLRSRLALLLLRSQNRKIDSRQVLHGHRQHVGPSMAFWPSSSGITMLPILGEIKFLSFFCVFNINYLHIFTPIYMYLHFLYFLIYTICMYLLILYIQLSPICM